MLASNFDIARLYNLGMGRIPHLRKRLLSLIPIFLMVKFHLLGFWRPDNRQFDVGGKLRTGKLMGD